MRLYGGLSRPPATFVLILVWLGLASLRIAAADTAEPAADANTGEPAYIVISLRAGNAAVPYPAIAPMFHDGHIVLDRSKLESAPRVTDSQLQDRRGLEWKQQADRYWESRNPPNLR